MCLLGKTRSQSIVCARLFVWFIILNTLISCQTFREEAESNLLRSLIHLQGVLRGSFQTPRSHGHPFQDQNVFPSSLGCPSRHTAGQHSLTVTPWPGYGRDLVQTPADRWALQNLPKNGTCPQSKQAKSTHNNCYFDAEEYILPS